jgi:hypothetical protein
MTKSTLIFQPIQVKFDGLDATNHQIDAEQLGKSIQGTARMYNAIAYTFFNGKIPAVRSEYKFRMQTRAEFVEGSVCYTLWCAMVMGEMALYPQLYGDIADLIIPNVLKSVYLKMVKREDKVKEIYTEMMGFIQEDRQRERESSERQQQIFANAFLQSQDRFLESIERLADNNRVPAQNSVAPIGKTATSLEHNNDTRTFLLIDEQMADAIRSKEELEVADLASYTVQIVEADKHKKGCHVLLEGYDKPIPCRISDPVILQTGNIYTQALNQDGKLRVKAKATLKNEKIKMLYISDAEEVR